MTTHLSSTMMGMTISMAHVLFVVVYLGACHIAIQPVPPPPTITMGHASNSPTISAKISNGTNEDPTKNFDSAYDGNKIDDSDIDDLDTLGTLFQNEDYKTRVLADHSYPQNVLDDMKRNTDKQTAGYWKLGYYLELTFPAKPLNSQIFIQALEMAFNGQQTSYEEPSKFAYLHQVWRSGLLSSTNSENPDLFLLRRNVVMACADAIASCDTSFDFVKMSGSEAQEVLEGILVSDIANDRFQMNSLIWWEIIVPILVEGLLDGPTGVKKVACNIFRHIAGAKPEVNLLELRKTGAFEVAANAATISECVDFVEGCYLVEKTATMNQQEQQHIEL